MKQESVLDSINGKPWYECLGMEEEGQEIPEKANRKHFKGLIDYLRTVPLPCTIKFKTPSSAFDITRTSEETDGSDALDSTIAQFLPAPVEFCVKRGKVRKKEKARYPAAPLFLTKAQQLFIALYTAIPQPFQPFSSKEMEISG